MNSEILGQPVRSYLDWKNLGENELDQDGRNAGLGARAFICFMKKDKLQTKLSDEASIKKILFTAGALSWVTSGINYRKKRILG